MQNEIIINAEMGETRVALLENKQFAELHIERERDKSVTGNVVKGKVSRVLPGMQAAFVDIGLEKAAFLTSATTSKASSRPARPTVSRTAEVVGAVVAPGRPESTLCFAKDRRSSSRSRRSRLAPRAPGSPRASRSQAGISC